MRRDLMLLGALLLATVAAGCSRAEPDPAGEAASTLSSSLQVYTTGDEVTFVLQIMNTAEEAIDIAYPSGQTHDFLVRAGEAQLWRWAEDQVFTQALVNDRLEPGESRRYDAIWRPGPEVEGELVVVGMLTSSSHPVEQTTRLVLD